MENSYGIGVTNKYSVFLEEDVDPFELLQNANKEKADKKSKTSGKENKNAPKVNSKTVKKPATKEVVEKPVTGETRGSGRGVGRRGGFAGASLDNKDERLNRRNRDNFRENRGGGFGGGFGESRTAPGDRPAGFSNFGSDDARGQVRGRGRGRGFRGGFGDSRGKREFDRHSGSDRSGVHAVDKRDGSGRGNWGSVQDDIAVATRQGADDNVEQTSDPEREAGATDEEAVEAVSDGPQEMTLDEWRKQQGERKQPQFNLRRAGEGEDQSMWNNTYELKKKTDNSEEDNDDDEEEEEETHVRHGRQKNFVTDIGFTFSDNRRGGRGRGRGARGDGFRGVRGGGFRGAARGGRGGEDFAEAPEGFRSNEFRGRGFRGNQRGFSRQHAPRVDDETAFPSLG